MRVYTLELQFDKCMLVWNQARAIESAEKMTLGKKKVAMIPKRISGGLQELDARKLLRRQKQVISPIQSN